MGRLDKMVTINGSYDVEFYDTDMSDKEITKLLKMEILHSETYEREGNDSWLIDKIQIIKEDGELILRHKVNHKGWNGPIKETTEINLDEYDTVEEKQSRVKEYMETNYLTPEMKVPDLKVLLNEE